MSGLNPFDLKGKRILVTGASSGIGASTAVLLARLGADVFLVGRSKERLEITAKSLVPGNHRIGILDLSKVVDIQSFYEQAVGDAGPFWGIAHCAGIQNLKPLRAITSDFLVDMFQTNVYSAFFLAKMFAKKGTSEPGGSFVVTSSVMGMAGEKCQGVYSATKAAIVGMVRSLALEFAPENLRINCVAPGVVDTPMGKKLMQSLPQAARDQVVAAHPLGIGTPEDVAGSIGFLLSPASRWITGTVLVVDGGFLAR
ncbi:MAG: SDR family oxidoreductase [Candidatus Riflebacteria bacterium]|nr:SDR family oxidoreductase [Candidatus Riflebacteria bacterium]